MIKIGTRALISINGRPLIATHWDGYPSCLGLRFLNCDLSKQAILAVAKAHTIDSADSTVRGKLNKERVKVLAKKHLLSEADIRSGKRKGYVISAEDYQIGAIENYGDWAEYQYDIRGHKIYFRPLHGVFPESLNSAAQFKLLTKQAARKD